MTEEKKRKILIDNLKDHPISVVLIVIVSVFAGLGALTESLDKTISFYEKHFKDTEISKPDEKYEVLEKPNTNKVENLNEIAIKYAPLIRIMANQKSSTIQKRINSDWEILKEIAKNGSVKLYLSKFFDSEDTSASQSYIDYLRNVLVAVDFRNKVIPNKLLSPSDSHSANSRTVDTGLAIVGINGKVIVATDGFIHENEFRKKVISVGKEGRPKLLNIISLDNSIARIGFAVPIYHISSQNKPTKVIAVLLGYKNVETYLSPLLKSTEPTIKSDEAMLVGLRNDLLVYLSPLRDGTTSMGMVLGSGKLHIAAPYSYRNPGQYKVLEDYSGSMVLCTGRIISGLPWVLVQKINVEEIATKY